MAKKKAEPNPDDETPPEQVESIRHRHYLAIREKNRIVKDAAHEWAGAKEQASFLRKNYDKENAELTELISRGPDPQMLLFDGADDWTSRPITELGLADFLSEKLVEEQIATLGDLQKFWQSGKYLSDVPGIGPERSASVADAFADYAKTHPEVYGDQGDDPEPPTEAA